MSDLYEGWVYVLTNPAMPGLVKIGFTTGAPEDRARQLDSTGVPMSFSVAFALFVVNPAQVEAWAHIELKSLRVNDDREFFRCSVETAKKVLLDACKGEIRNEMVREDGILSAIRVLHSGDVINCPQCKGEIRPFNSVLTDREKGVAKCASCGHEIRFRMRALKPVLTPVSITNKHDNELMAKIHGDYFRDENVIFECPNCYRRSTLQPRHIMRCPSCGGWYKPDV